ncbi:hypothetical protein [Acholeplasma laidlawii]|uniref:DUF4145 domain-containing protein n=1 Tax=Acholeplasma laidlawii TaxID=2148 RepID=A0A553IGG2_ACHLA|nr:hypothetical protein [Acholeplasma laidlawii]NWH10911.1 hypothetical protein [Acholeplasma laidlawii]NWH12297.1 hypothetical protein [Acholeplasma laidlawii]NWH13683.1 hypothetical protein [Acholeplasma laidlawii]NWH15072.1 hypothetical protein [Acholeplasma laidlawii]TRX99296.1 hypothetical protein FNV44_06225 [Acholeplasma laidlawii]
MKDKLELFSSKIPDINHLQSSKLIKYFSYFLLIELEQSYFTAKNILECYETLLIKPYSNIPDYLGKNSKGRNATFGKKTNGYYLHRNAIENIRQKLSIIKEVPVTNNLISMEIFNGTPYYIKKIAEQMNQCYDSGLFDATLVIIRKILETLIIETFEKFKCDNLIKDDNGNFKYLSDLIPVFINSKFWNNSRNLKNNIMQIKKYGDLSAHNRRFLAKKSDLDHLKSDLRQVIEEIVLIIDYPGSKKI